MAIVVACPCGKKLQAKDELAGKRVKCPSCGQPITVPAPGGMSTQAPAVPSPRKAPAPRPAADPLGSNPLFADLSSLERAAGSLNPPNLGGGAWTTDPLATPMTNPLMGPGAWQQPARKSRGNPVMVVGIAGGAVAAVIIIGFIAAVLLRNKPASNTESVATNKPVTEAASAPSSPSEPSPSSSSPSTTEPAPTPAQHEPASSIKIELTPKPDIEPRPETTAETTPKTGSSKPAAQARTFRDLIPGVSDRLAKSDPLKGVTLVGDDAIIVAGYSWLTELLPYIGEEERHKKFDFTKSWSDKVNLQLTGPVEAFLNPADSRKSWKGWPYDGIGLTHFVGISGIEETRNDVAAMLPRSDPRAGVFGYHEVARPEQITDGTSQTLLLMGSGNLAGPWVQGGGATIRGLREPYFDPLTGFGSQGLTEPGALAVFADGSVKTISAKVSPKVLRNMATIHGSDSVDLSTLGDVVK